MQSHHRRFRCLIGALLALLLSTCGTTSDDSNAECRANTDCAGGESCVEGRCWELCVETVDCFGYCDGNVTQGTSCVDSVCVAGECEVESECDGVVCDSPPAVGCFDANTLRTYKTAGICGGGDCSYAIASDENCPGGCSGSKCSDVTDPCSTITCTTPPTASCVDRTKTAYSNPGTCSDGNCSYSESTVTCTWMCEGTGCLSDSSYTVDCGGVGGYGSYSSIEALLVAASGESSAIQVNGVHVHTGFGPAIQCAAAPN